MSPPKGDDKIAPPVAESGLQPSFPSEKDLQNLKNASTSSTSSIRHTLGVITASLIGFWDGVFDSISIWAIIALISSTFLSVTFPPAGIPILISILIPTLFAGVRSAAAAVAEENQEHENFQKELEEVLKYTDPAKLAELQQELNALARATSDKELLVKTSEKEFDDWLPKAFQEAENKLRKELQEQGVNADDIEKAVAKLKSKLEAYKTKLSINATVTYAIAIKTPDPYGIIKDTVDVWSRRLRNAFGLSALCTLPVFAFLGLTPPGLVVLGLFAIGMAAQILPRLIKETWVDNPRNQAKKELEEFNRQRTDAIAQHQALEDKLQHYSAEKHKIQHDLDNFTANAINDVLFATETADDPILATTVASLTATSPVTDVATLSFSQQLLRAQTDLQQHDQTGHKLAGLLGFANGALHPIAWAGIVLVILSLFFPPAAIGLGGFILGVGIIGVATVIGGAFFGRMLAKRTQEKERADRDKVKDEFDKAVKKAAEIENQLQKELEQKNRLLLKYEKYRKLLLQKVQKNWELHSSVSAFDDRYQSLLKEYQQLEIERQANNEALKLNFATAQDYFNGKEPVSFFHKTMRFLGIYEKEKTIDNKQTPLARRIRDFCALFETPTGAVLGLLGGFAFIAASPLVLGIALCAGAIIIGISIYKDRTIDCKREDSLRRLKIANSVMEKSANDFTRKGNVIAAKQILLERQLEQQANIFLRQQSPAATQSPTIISHRRKSVQHLGLPPHYPYFNSAGNSPGVEDKEFIVPTRNACSANHTPALLPTADPDEALPPLNLGTSGLSQ